MHWLHAVLHLALVPTRSPAACGRSRRAQPVRMVGADLEGGENEQRNAALAALRRSFLASSAEEEELPDRAIDWICANQHATPILANVLRPSPGLLSTAALHASDHFPVVAVYEI